MQMKGTCLRRRERGTIPRVQSQDGTRPMSEKKTPQDPAAGRHHVEVVAGAIARDGTYLLCRRPGGSNMEGHWEFPGGKVKEGETQEEALRRELEEELGIEVLVAGHLSTVEYSYPHLDITLHLFSCPSFEGEPRKLYHSAIAWVRGAEIDRDSLVPSNLPFLDILP